MTYYLSLGSNLGNKRRNLVLALDALEKAGGRVSRASSVYRTEPVGLVVQPWFYNLAVAVETRLAPEELLDLIQMVEAAQGRVRTVRSGPRTIDIDILLAGRRVVRTARLQIPHPRLERRNFVLAPLAEIAPAAVHPVLRKTVRSLLMAAADRSSVEKLGTLRRRVR